MYFLLTFRLRSEYIVKDTKSFCVIFGRSVRVITMNSMVQNISCRNGRATLHNEIRSNALNVPGSREVVLLRNSSMYSEFSTCKTFVMYTSNIC